MFFRLWALASIFSLSSFAASTECKAFSAPVAGGYCVHRPAASKNPDVLYYLHGRGFDETKWNDPDFFGEQLRQHWKTHRWNPPTVVSISLGKIWVLAEKNQSPVSGLFEVFVQSLLPAIENEIGGVRGRRLLMGDSMGGFNATQLAFKTKLFRKAALLCVPIAAISPFAAPEEINAFIEGSSAWQYYKDTDPAAVRTAVAEMLQLGRAFYPTPGNWEKADPLRLAALAQRRSLPDLYIAAGMYDRFALYEGNEAFSNLLTRRLIPREWRPQWGGHCSIDIPSLARFLAAP